MKKILPLAVFALSVFSSLPFLAQNTASAASPAAPPVSQNVRNHIQSLQKHCIPGKWETPACLSAQGLSNKDLSANYAENLQNGSSKQDADALIQHCAASTAASQQKVPAYAMASAMTECANAMSDTANKTKILPDQTHYQLLIAGVLCLNNSEQCASFEQAIGNFK